ncbi:MAG TPA: thiamine pyrophosphate-binding protein [Casimicrobiaceae bacterium]|nr:thiamine pyrophosphate-binding protein [Casimicrobiaceae bacterium]
MKLADRPAAPSSAISVPEQLWGSDAVAQLLRELGIEYIALSPGASFRGLHDSLVNHLGNTRPGLLLCLHEEHCISIAHGYARVTRRPMAVALHSNVGLMHATMAIFNAWCDRVPMLMLGGVGPMDAMQRRPWVDWIHTARDLGALVRGYIKWDDQPSSVPAALEAIVRAWQIAQTPPQGPTFVCLDASLQEQLVDPAMPLPPVQRFALPDPAEPSDPVVTAAADALTTAKSIVLLVGRVSGAMDDWTARVELAERLGAIAITDLKQGASFPTTHPLHPYPPGLFVSTDAAPLLRDADVIVSLDWVDLGGTLRQACGGEWPRGKIIQCSMDQYVHNGWSMDYQSLPPAEISILAPPDRLVHKLLAALPASPRAYAAPPRQSAAAPSPGSDRISVDEMAHATADALSAEHPSYLRLSLGWPGELCRFEHPLDYIGFDGGGGLASGPGMAIGAAMALRDARSDRLPVAVLGDGDFMMGVSAIWTGVHYRVPVLIIVANNQSFFNDELHQERVARTRNRPVENRWIGMRMSDPPLDLALLARGQGAVGLGPVHTIEEYRAAIAAGIAQVRAGATCVIDVHVAPEYARAVSSAILRHIPNQS